MNIKHDLGFKKVEFSVNGQVMVYDENYRNYDATKKELSNKSENKKNVEVEGSTTYIMDDMKSQVRLIIDSTDVFTGNVEEKHECSCLYSKNSNFVDVFKEMLRSEIVLLEQKYNKKDTVLVAMSSNI